MKLGVGLLTIVLLICLGSSFILVSCEKKSDKNFDKLDKMKWLIGNWENKTPNGLLTESWVIINDSTFTGNSFFITEKDTVHFESTVMSQTKDALVLTATVIGQNNDKPVNFKLTSETSDSFVFENPIHDYPQKIVYKKVNDTNLIATISGIQQGKKSSESYPMKKK